MKSVITLALLLAAVAQAQTYVRPHVRQDGTFVEGHYRSAPNSTRTDNYSSEGNYNPYTGKAGTVDPYKPRACGYTASGRYVCN